MGSCFEKVSTKDVSRMIHYIVIFIYVTFIWDFFICPIPSEASTKALSDGKAFIVRTLLTLVFVVGLSFYVFPFILSISALISSEIFSIHPLTLSISLILAISGRIITIVSSYHLAKSNSSIFTKSFFSISRNPISLGTYLTFFGLCLIYNSWYLWFGLAFYIINIHIKICIEEKHLQEKYGSSYEDYRNHTPRYLLL